MKFDLAEIREWRLGENDFEPEEKKPPVSMRWLAELAAELKAAFDAQDMAEQTGLENAWDQAREQQCRAKQKILTLLGAREGGYFLQLLRAQAVPGPVMAVRAAAFYQADPEREPDHPALDFFDELNGWEAAKKSPRRKWDIRYSKPRIVGGSNGAG